MITNEDSASLAYRNLIPYPKKKCLIITEISEYPKISNVSSYIMNHIVKFPAPELIKEKHDLNKIINSLPFPTLIKVEKMPIFIEDKNIEIPTLSNFFPFPLDPKNASLEVKHEAIKSISGLSFFSNLKVLVLSLNKISKIQNLPATLTHLDLSQNVISSIPDLQLPYLEDLILDLNLITNISGLGYCTNLRSLSMNSNKLSKISGLEKCKLLEKALFYRNKLKDIQPDTFNSNVYLIHLDLGRNKLRSINFLSSLKLLKSLILYQNAIESIEGISLVQLQEL